MAATMVITTVTTMAITHGPRVPVHCLGHLVAVAGQADRVGLELPRIAVAAHHGGRQPGQPLLPPLGREQLALLLAEHLLQALQLRLFLPQAQSVCKAALVHNCGSYTMRLCVESQFSPYNM